MVGKDRQKRELVGKDRQKRELVGKDRQERERAGSKGESAGDRQTIYRLMA